MEELVNQIAQRTGISADKARTAVDTVVGYLKERLPDPVASQLDSVVSGKATGGGFSDAAQSLGGMFGKK
jgi:hypothetical protein